jgi:hypothetical protein
MDLLFTGGAHYANNTETSMHLDREMKESGQKICEI